MTPLGLKLVQKYQPCCRYIPVQNVSVCTLIPWLPMINTSKKHPPCGAFQIQNPHRTNHPTYSIDRPTPTPVWRYLPAAPTAPSIHIPALPFPLRPPQPPHTASLVLMSSVWQSNQSTAPDPTVPCRCRPSFRGHQGTISISSAILASTHEQARRGGEGAPSRSLSSLTIHRTRSNGTFCWRPSFPPKAPHPLPAFRGHQGTISISSAILASTHEQARGRQIIVTYAYSNVDPACRLLVSIYCEIKIAGKIGEKYP